MGTIKNKRSSLTKIIIKSIFIMGVCMALLSVAVLVFISLLGRGGLYESKYFPQIELFILFVYLLLMLVLLLLVPHLTAKHIQKKGKALIEVTHQIQSQNLNFEVAPTGIYEIDQVLDAMDELKGALATSLSNEWALEQNKRLQLSALMHDLKAPITVLKGNLYLLNYEALSEDGTKAISDMESCLSDMDYYIKKLLEVSKMNGTTNYEMESCSFTDLLNEVLASMKVLLESKNILLTTTLEEKTLWVMGNSYELKRCIQNLLSNAIDFTPNASSIEIVLTSDENNLTLTITDSGEGFSEEALKHAKEQFYMSDSSRNRQKHYGLGLFITEQILHAHHGELVLTNHPTKHSGQVMIHLPLEMKN